MKQALKYILQNNDCQPESPLLECTLHGKADLEGGGTDMICQHCGHPWSLFSLLRRTQTMGIKHVITKYEGQECKCSYKCALCLQSSQNYTCVIYGLMTK